MTLEENKKATRVRNVSREMEMERGHRLIPLITPDNRSAPPERERRVRGRLRHGSATQDSSLALDISFPPTVTIHEWRRQSQLRLTATATVVSGRPPTSEEMEMGVAVGMAMPPLLLHHRREERGETEAKGKRYGWV